MKIGLMPGALRDAAALGQLAASVEAAGFDSLWMGDHVSFPAPILDPLAVLACYAAHTDHLLLGTCVYLLPLRHPTPVAKMVASLDFLSRGRLIFGIGVGGEFPREFEACGVPLRERGARANESIEVLRRLWSGAAEPFHGRFFEVPSVPIVPPPARPGGPPIWVGGRSEAALRRAARHGDGYVGYLLGPEAFRERMERIRELRAGLGASERRITGALLVFSFVDEDRERAVARAARALGRARPSATPSPATSSAAASGSRRTRRPASSTWCSRRLRRATRSSDRSSGWNRSSAGPDLIDSREGATETAFSQERIREAVRERVESLLASGEPISQAERLMHVEELSIAVRRARKAEHQLSRANIRGSKRNSRSTVIFAPANSGWPGFRTAFRSSGTRTEGT